MLQFLRVVFGINSSPFLVQFVSGGHAIKKKTEIPEVAETVLWSKYIHDSIDFKSSDVRTIELYQDLSKLWVGTSMYTRK